MSRPCGNVLVGVCGSFHATQIPQYLVALRRQLTDSVTVMMTRQAATMIDPRVVGTLSSGPPVLDLWGTQDMPSPHIRLTGAADLFVVLPATANMLGKAANGVADDLVSTAIVAYPGSVVFAPSMNPRMWHNRTVQRNIAALRTDEHIVVSPQTITSVTTGRLDEGLGPTVDTLLPELWHVVMKTRQQRYFPTATAEQPRTPAVRAVESNRRSAGMPTVAAKATGPGRSPADADTDVQPQATTF